VRQGGASDPAVPAGRCRETWQPESAGWQAALARRAGRQLCAWLPTSGARRLPG